MKQRTLKFRAWSKEQNKFVSGYEASTYVWGWQNDETGSHVTLGHDRFVLMQFTGLTDKHGREIYEGDVVEYVEAEVTPLSEEQIKKDPPGTIYGAALIEGRPEVRHREVVEIINGRLSFDMTGDEWPYEENAWVVIGNVYENPELLRKEEDDNLLRQGRAVRQMDERLDDDLDPCRAQCLSGLYDLRVLWPQTSVGRSHDLERH